MFKLLLASAVVVAAIGCGGPHCSDAIENANAAGACTGQGRPYAYCKCAVDFLFARISCQEYEAGAISTADYQAACAHCAPLYGLTCNGRSALEESDPGATAGRLIFEEPN